ncbi:MAG: hypothetical protein R3309_03450, partial [Reinekea sp.]|nr:hypothetical protein [Reinekea sp.]
GNNSEGDNGVVPYLPLWIGSTLHMVPDLQSSEPDVPTWYPSLALLYPTTVPMSFGETYEIGGFATTMTDVFNNALTVPVFGSNENIVQIRPANGWYSSTLTQNVPAAIATADTLKFAAPFDQYNWKNYALNNDLPENFRIELSAINFGWEGIQLAVFDQENATARGTDDWWTDSLVKIRLGNWTEFNYQTSRGWDSGNGYYSWANNSWLSGETRNAFDGKWKRYRLDVYGTTIAVSISEDGTNFDLLSITNSDPLDEFTVNDFVGLTDPNDDGNANTEYHLVLRTVSALALDNVEVTTLTVGGAIATSAGDIMSLDGASVPTELNTTASYSFDNW